MQINLTKENMNVLATRLAEESARMGFTKNDKPMVASQGLRLLASLAGYREEHSLIAALKAETPSKPMLDADSAYLVQARTTEASKLVSEHSAESAKALLLGTLGYAIYPDAVNPGRWLWNLGNHGCLYSMESMDAAIEDAWRGVAGATKAKLTLDETQWYSLSLVEQIELIRRTASPAKSPMQEAIADLQQRFEDEHGFYSREDWGTEVGMQNTSLSYWEWVVHRIESNGGEEEHCSDCGFLLDGESWDGKCGNCADKEDDDLDLPLPDRQRKLADDAYESYDFGAIGRVVDADGWDCITGGTHAVFARNVYLETNPDLDSTRVSFGVTLEGDVVQSVGLL